MLLLAVPVRPAARRLFRGDHEVGETHPPGKHVSDRHTQPFGQGIVGMEDAPGGVGREKSGRQVVEKISQHFFFAAADGIHFAPRRDVLGPPQGAALAFAERMNGNAPPFDVARGHPQGNLGHLGDAGRSTGAQAGKGFSGILAAAHDGGDVIQRHRQREQPVKGGVGVHERTVGGGDQAPFRTFLGGGQKQIGHMTLRPRAAPDPGKPEKRQQGEPPPDESGSRQQPKDQRRQDQSGGYRGPSRRAPPKHRLAGERIPGLSLGRRFRWLCGQSIPPRFSKAFQG